MALDDVEQHCAEKDRVSDARHQYTVIAEKSLFDVLREIWQAKFLVLVFVFVALCLAYVFIALSVPHYRAEMVLAPAYSLEFYADERAGHMDAVRSPQYTGKTPNDPFMVFEALYNGPSVASSLMRDDALLERLRDERSFMFSKKYGAWSVQILSQYLSRRVRLEPLSGTLSSLRRMSYSHPDPDVAMSFLKRLHQITDQMIRLRILVQTNDRISYIRGALDEAVNPDHRRSLTDVLMEQERIKMMVSSDQPYAASIVEPAYVLPRTSWPDPFVVYPVFLFVGLLIGYIVAIFFRHRAVQKRG
ncbi:MAG: hypothetical protein ACLFP8_08590 [Alphaproteobacteria bacterium]